MQAKDGNNVSGRGRQSTPFYEEIDAILGHRAASQPMILIGSGNIETGVAATMRCDRVLLLMKWMKFPKGVSNYTCWIKCVQKQFTFNFNDYVEESLPVVDEDDSQSTSSKVSGGSGTNTTTIDSTTTTDNTTTTNATTNITTTDSASATTTTTSSTSNSTPIASTSGTAGSSYATKPNLFNKRKGIATFPYVICLQKCTIIALHSR